MDKRKFDDIVNQESKKLYNYILKMIRVKEESEDVLQDVFISFWNKIEQVNESTYHGYLYRTAYNKSLNRIKKLKKTKKVSLDNIGELQAKSENNYNDEIEELVAQALAQLKPKESILLELQYFQNLSYAEIAERMKLSISAVDSRLFRAKKKLKKIILQDSRNLDVSSIEGGNNGKAMYI